MFSAVAFNHGKEMLGVREILESPASTRVLVPEFELTKDGIVSFPAKEFLLPGDEDQVAASPRVDERALLYASFGLFNSVHANELYDTLNGGEIVDGWKLEGETIYFSPSHVRRSFYKKHPDVDDRTLLLFPDYERIMLASGKERKLLATGILRIFNAIHLRQNKSGYMGLSFAELLEKDWKISQGSVFETKPWPVAKSFAYALRTRIGHFLGNSRRYSADKNNILEFGTGAGTTALALGQDLEGLPKVDLTTLEKDHTLFSWFIHNLNLDIPGLDQIRRSVHPVIANVVDFLREINGETPRGFGAYVAHAIFADPPWRAAYASIEGRRCRNLKEMFFLSTRGEHTLDLRGEKIKEILEKIKNESVDDRLPKLFSEYDLWTAEDVISVVFSHNIAPIIAFHVPSKGFDYESLYDSAERLGAHVEIIRHIGNDGARPLEEVQVIFYKKEHSKDTSAHIETQIVF